MKKSSVCFLSAFFFLLLFAVMFSASADDIIPQNAPDLSGAGSFAVYNIENDRYVISKNAQYMIAPSSTAKIMTGLLVCELLEDRAEEWVTLDASMLSGASGKSFGLSAGQRVTVRSLMIAAFSGGYNDAVIALANICAGSQENFVELMNAKAESLGMESTVYKNATGLDTAGMKSTLYDTVLLAAKAADNELFLDVSSHFTAKIMFGDGSTKISYSGNLLLSENSQYYCKSVRGMNSGMTDWGGGCLVTYGTHNGARYIAIAVGCAEDDSRFALVQDALDFVYNNYSYRTLLEKGTYVGETKISLAISSTSGASLVLNEDLRVFCANDEVFDDFSYSLVLPYDIPTAPVSVGDAVAYYTVWNGTELFGSARVTTKENIERSAILLYINAVKNYITGRAFLSSLVILAAVGLIALILPMIMLKIRQRKRRYVRHRGGFKLK